MQKLKTHFEQAPLELVKKIARLDLPEGQPVAPPSRDKAKAQRRAAARKRTLPRSSRLKKDDTVLARDVKRRRSLEQTLETVQ